MRSDLVDVTGRIHAETAQAILFSDTGERKDAVWLPKAQIEIETPKGHVNSTVTMPEWLALDKGLI